MPRSGTSWISQIWDSHPNVRFRLSPLFSYAFKNAVNEDSTSQEWNNFLNKVCEARDDFMDQGYRRRDGDYPIFTNKSNTPSHLLIKDTRYHNLTEAFLENVLDSILLYIVRHPCGAINSWLNCSGEFPKQANPHDEWLTGNCRKTGKEEFWGFKDWMTVTQQYLDMKERYPDRVLIIQYEDIVQKPIKKTENMFAFSGLKLHNQTIQFLDYSQDFHNEREYSVFKNKNVIYRWKDELNVEIAKKIMNSLRGTRLEVFTKC